MVGRPREARRNRRALSPNSIPTAGVLIVAVSLVAGKMRLTSTEDLIIGGVPQSVTSLGVKGTGIVRVSAGVYDVTFAVAPVAAGAWAIGGNDPALRTRNGGFVAAATGTF